jgi:hypothetical protein
MKITSANAVPSAMDVLNFSRPAFTLRATISSRPGS